MVYYRALITQKSLVAFLYVLFVRNLKERLETRKTVTIETESSNREGLFT